MHRPVPFLFALLLTACEADLPPAPDEGTDPAVCYQELDGGVFATGLVAPVPGCAQVGQATGTIDLADAGWSPQGGLLVVPAGTGATPLPVVLVFHGAYSSGATVRDLFQLEPAADGGAIFVYPNAVAGTWDLGENSKDGRLVDQLLRHLASSYCIDPERIYAAGVSAGAVFTLFLGCNEASTFAAIGTVAGTSSRFDSRCCTGPIPAMLIHGTEDQTITFADGQAARNGILGRNACTSSAPVPDGANCVAYPGCPAAEPVDWCAWLGDHEIPPWGGAAVWGFFAGLQ